MRLIGRIAALAAFLLLAACATRPAHVAPFPSRTQDADADIAACARLITAADDAVDAAQVRDGGVYAVPGYPYLRADRFTAAQSSRLSADAWLDSLRALGRDSRRVEFANLPRAARVPLVARANVSFPGVPLEQAVETCGDRLLDVAKADGTAPREVVVPDDYQTWKRVAGLYPVTRLGVAAGICSYQRETERTFALPLDQLPVRGPVERYVPRLDVDALTALGFEVDLARALESNAPLLEVETATDYDRLGAPTLDDDGAPQVDVAHPSAFVRVAHTLVGQQVLTQLVYGFWFPSRPRTGAFDLLGGRLDGIIWRVTLDAQGRPWVYDSIHPCGCYHQFFPTPRALARPKPGTMDEWAFIPEELPDVAAGQRISLRVAARTHYLQRVSVLDEVPPGVEYQFARDADLRSIQLRDGTHRSLFRPDGIIAGTERRERWFLWPMGVREPGAMRQWGRQATAFVGRRHFDDPHLLDRYFELRP